MQLLKQSTTASLVVGPVLDSTGLEYASAVIGDLSLSKNGGTLTALASAATLTYIANGQYTLALTTGNTDTLGRADLFCNKSGYQMPPVRLTVLAATAFDTLITNGTLASTTSGRTLVVDAAGLADANAVKVGPTGAGTAQTARDLGANLDATVSSRLAASGGSLSLTSLTVSGATTLTGNVSLAAGLTITQSTADTPAVSITGNGVGDGIRATGGATNGCGMLLLGTAAGAGLSALGGLTGKGVSLSGGAVSGDGLGVQSTSGHGINVLAAGASKHGVLVTGGDSGTCDGLKAVAGTGGVPIRGNITGNLTGSVTGSVASVSGAVGSVTGNVGGNVTGSAGSVVGAVGSVTGNVGGNVTGSVGSVVGAVASVTANVSAVLANGVTHGGATAVLRLGSSSATPALYATNSGGPAVKFEATTGGEQGLVLVGDGGGAGLTIAGGENGAGIEASSGGSSSDALFLFSPARHAINAVSAGGAAASALRLQSGGPGLTIVAAGNGVDVSSSGAIGVYVLGNAAEAVKFESFGGNALSLLTYTGDALHATSLGAGVGARSTPDAVGFGGTGGTVDANVVSINGTTFAGANTPSVLANGVAHGGTPGSSTATLALKLLNVTATGFDDAVQINGGGAALNLFSGNDSDCITINADGVGISVSGGTQGVLVSGSTVGLDVAGGSNNPGLRVLGAGTAAAVQLGDGSTGAAGLLVQGGSSGSAGASFLGKTSGTGVLATGGTSGAGARLVGGSSSGNGLVVVATAGDGAVIQGGDDGSNGAGLKILPGASTSEAAVQLGDGTSGAEGVKVLAGTGNTNADGVTATGAGTGVGFHSTPDAVGFGGGGTFPANFSSLVIDADGRVLTDRVAFSGTLPNQGLGSAVDVVLPSGPAANGVLTGSRLRVYAGDGQYQERTITTWNGTDKIAGIDRSWFGVSVAAGDLFHVLYDNAPQLDGSGNVAAVATVTAITAAALGQFFTLNSGAVYVDAVAGSVVKEIAVNGTKGAGHSVR